VRGRRRAVTNPKPSRTVHHARPAICGDPHPRLSRRHRAEEGDDGREEEPQSPPVERGSLLELPASAGCKANRLPTHDTEGDGDKKDQAASPAISKNPPTDGPRARPTAWAAPGCLGPPKRSAGTQS